MIRKNAFGVDLGTSVVKIYSLRKNRLLSEHDMIAIMGGTAFPIWTNCEVRGPSK